MAMICRYDIAGTSAAIGDEVSMFEATDTRLHVNKHKNTTQRARDCNAPQIVLVNNGRRPHPQPVFVCIVADDPEGLFCPFQAGDGFGFGFSSTEWISIGTERG
jgi:hypothetical protein